MRPTQLSFDLFGEGPQAAIEAPTILESTIEVAPDGAHMRYELRPYQADARAAVHGVYAKGGKRALVVAATGSGKTVLFSALAADYVAQGRRVLILTDQYDLVDQAMEDLLAATGIYADAEQGDRRASSAAMVVVATIQTLKSRLGHFPPDYFALVVADECDRAMASQWMQVLTHFDKHANVLGVTATPKRSDKKDILGYFETKAYEIGVFELIELGYLVPITVQHTGIKMDVSQVEKRAGDLDAKQVGHVVETVFDDVCDAIQEHAPKRKTLCFLPLVETSKKFVQRAQARGLNARHIDGSMSADERSVIKREFKDGRFHVLSNPCLLGRGYNNPSIDAIVNLRITESLSFYQQVIGRGTRIYCPHGCRKPCQHVDRKIDLLVLDFLYQFKGMGPMRPANLIGATQQQVDAINAASDRSQGRLDLRNLETTAKADIEAALIKALMDAQKKMNGKKGEYYNAYQWAANMRLDDLTDYTPDNPTDAAPPTERILKKLQKAGFIPETIVSQGHAERILKVIDTRREAGLASMKQVFWLRKWGYKDPENIDQETARKIFARECSRY